MGCSETYLTLFNFLFLFLLFIYYTLDCGLFTCRLDILFRFISFRMDFSFIENSNDWDFFPDFEDFPEPDAYPDSAIRDVDCDFEAIRAKFSEILRTHETDCLDVNFLAHEIHQTTKPKNSSTVIAFSGQFPNLSGQNIRYRRTRLSKERKPYTRKSLPTGAKRNIDDWLTSNSNYPYPALMLRDKWSREFELTKLQINTYLANQRKRLLHIPSHTVTFCANEGVILVPRALVSEK